MRLLWRSVGRGGVDGLVCVFGKVLFRSPGSVLGVAWHGVGGEGKADRTLLFETSFGTGRMSEVAPCSRQQLNMFGCRCVFCVPVPEHRTLLLMASSSFSV